MEPEPLRIRMYRFLRKKGYTASQALWDVRKCSNYYWQKQMFPAWLDGVKFIGTK